MHCSSHNHVCRAYIMLLLLLINHPLTGASAGCDPGLIWSRFGLRQWGAFFLITYILHTLATFITFLLQLITYLITYSHQGLLGLAPGETKLGIDNLSQQYLVSLHSRQQHNYFQFVSWRCVDVSRKQFLSTTILITNHFYQRFLRLLRISTWCRNCVN
jgi:hypothetical protein